MRELQLTKGKVAYVDDDIFEEVSKVKWCATHCPDGQTGTFSKWYAKNWKLGYLHRFIMKPEQGEVVDHLDDNGLNCLRENMRLTTQRHNCTRGKRVDPVEAACAVAQLV